MAKILLIYPPAHSNKYKPRRACFPLGIAYIASVLREGEFQVSAIDCVVEGFDDIEAVDKKGKLIIYGLYGDKLKERIASEHPDIVGISCPYYTTQETTLNIARLAKESGVKWVVVGGIHASGVPEYFLNSGYVDFVIIGEGEFSFLELAKVLSSGSLDNEYLVDGLAYKKDGAICINPKTKYMQDVDLIPYPARDLFPMEKYFQINVPNAMASFSGRATEFITSRGCPFKCWFCASTVFGGNHRPRSPENVLGEMQMLKDVYGVRELQLVDDNPAIDRNRLITICKAMIERKINLKWGTPNALGSFAMDEEIIKLMVLSGFYFTHFAVESGSQRVLTDIMKKPTQVDKTTYIAKLFRRYGVDVSLVFCVGMPGETFKDIEETFRYAASLPAYEAFFYFATPLFGTPLYDLCKQKKYIPDNLLELEYGFQEPIITTPEWTPAELKKFVRRRVALLHFIYFIRNPLGFILRYFRRYRKNLSTFKSFFSFLIKD